MIVIVKDPASIASLQVVGLNFSSATTPELLLKTLDHYCEYRKTPNGMVRIGFSRKVPSCRPGAEPGAAWRVARVVL